MLMIWIGIGIGIGLRRRGRRLGPALLWIFLLLAATVATNFVGIHLAGSIEGWRQWQADHNGHFGVLKSTPPSQTGFMERLRFINAGYEINWWATEEGE